MIGLHTRNTIVRQAQPSETGVISDILIEAARWLQSIGQPLWRDGELSAEHLHEDVSRGLFYLVTDHENVAGVFKMQVEDPIFWPDAPEGQSVYLHRLAVRRVYAGKGISNAMIHFAQRRAIELGRKYLRLDCEASRSKLCRIYERAGFMKHSEKQVGPYYVARYQMELNVRNHIDSPSCARILPW